MENIKSFNQFVNENYINEGLFSTLKSGAKKATELISGKISSQEDWWKSRQASGDHLTNDQYVAQLVRNNIADELTEEDRDRIGRQAQSDGFEGEVKWNRNKSEWCYVTGNNIKLGSFNGGYK